jgi:hypothetical protein
VTANDWIDTPDYGAYFGNGLVHYVASNAGTDVQSEARIWVNKRVSSQDPEGYIDAFQPSARWQNWYYLRGPEFSGWFADVAALAASIDPPAPAAFHRPLREIRR